MHRAGSITRRSICRLLGIFPFFLLTAARTSTATMETAPRNAKPDTSPPSTDQVETANASNDNRFEAYRGVVEETEGGYLVVRLEANGVGVDRFVDERPPGPAIVDGDEVIVLFEDGYPRTTIPTTLGEG